MLVIRVENLLKANPKILRTEDVIAPLGQIVVKRHRQNRFDRALNMDKTQLQERHMHKNG